MAAQFSFGRVGPIIAGQLTPSFMPSASETISESGSNQQTDAVAPAGVDIVCRVVATVDVYVSFGSSPNAGTDANKVYMPALAIEYFAVRAGWKGAVVTV
jgi:hypothetical protein